MLELVAEEIMKNNKEGIVAKKPDLTGQAGRPNRTMWLAKTGILAAAAIALMYLEISLPLFPTFLKFDFSKMNIVGGTHQVLRFCTSWATSSEDIDALIEFLKTL